MTLDARAPTLVADRYALHERVGQGGCGVVYRATDQHTGHSVAIKMLTRAARQDPSFVERLVREQQALQALAGTHAVGAIDLCRAGTGELCLVMEWLEGTDLEQRLTGLEQLGTPLGADELWRVMEPVLQTLEKAHELGIVHRDIKPANIFVLSGDRGVRLLDFGFSRLKSSATLTAADAVMGSPSYIAPEAWQHGSKAIEKQADLYAAGVIVFRALAGRVPFTGASLVETMQLVTNAPRPSLCALRPDLPPVMDDWVAHALAVDPARRFQHAQSFLDALHAALAGSELPPHALPAASPHPDTAPPPKTTPAERQNALSVALGRAASLLKRVASSLSRTPGAPEPSDTLAPAAAALPAPPPLPPAPQRAKPARPPTPREPEADELIAELLPPSLPPPAADADERVTLEPLAPLPTIAIESPAVAVDAAAVAPPVVEPPAIEAPAVAPPAVEAPVMEAPAVEAPAIDAPAIDAPAIDAPAIDAPPALAKAPEKAAVKREGKGSARARKTRKRATPLGTTEAEAAVPAKSARASQRPTAKKATKKQAPKHRTAKPAPNDQPTTNNTPKRRTKKTSVDAAIAKPKARKRATKQQASQPPAPPKPAAKPARAKSGKNTSAQASKRTST